NSSAVFTFLNEYPIFPVLIFVTNAIAFFPIFCLLYISQIAPLHGNCRYILCAWSLSFSSVYLINIALAILDLENESGYMPRNMFEPHFRFLLYQIHIMCTTFCSTFEIALSIERMIAIVNPRRYHFSDTEWKVLIPISAVLV
ncbi:hypothetical protein PENTCL1PPCAC_15446, partial [Pristionchus entomophagus]